MLAATVQHGDPELNRREDLASRSLEDIGSRLVELEVDEAVAEVVMAVRRTGPRERA